MNLLQGKVALITGASSGIGRVAALLFSAEGANVVLNARGAAALEHVAARIRSQGGEVRIVAGDASQPGMAAYGAARAGLMGLVKGIAADYGDQGIRANALMPGGVDTAMAGNAEQKEWAAGLHAMKRIARPEEIASAALFLASPMASFVTGSAMFADGGNSAVK